MERGWHYWRNLGRFLLVVIALVAMGLAAGLAWMQADAFLHPRRLPLPETPGERKEVLLMVQIKEENRSEAVMSRYKLYQGVGPRPVGDARAESRLAEPQDMSITHEF